MLKNFLLLILIDTLELQMDTNMIQLHYLKKQTFQVTTKMFIKIPINYNIYEPTSKYFKSQHMAITKVLVWYIIICNIILKILFYYCRSLAVTGCKAWTVYTNTGNSGNCMCVYPKDQYNCEVGLYPDLGYFNNNIASVRTGCHCSYSKYPPLP